MTDRQARASVVRAAARRVRFSEDAPVVHTVPRRNGGRGLEPGYEARKKRQKALRLHGIKTPLKFVDRDWGEDSAAGRRGRYTELDARHNLWHAQRYGDPLYVKTRMGDRFYFARRYVDEKHRQRLDEYDALMRRRHAKPVAKPLRRAVRRGAALLR